MVYNFIPAQNTEVPILISVPHCGIQFPDKMRSQFREDLIEFPDDTDWFVDQLYDFAPAMGVSMVTARYSRWVIDLNRDPQGRPLYSDGRIITALCPTTTFLGDPIYRDKRTELSGEDIHERITSYYEPYHQRLQDEIARLKAKFGGVLLWDCHSIRQVVKSIQKDKFPDLILGDADGTSASMEMIDTALKNLGTSSFAVSHNHPFKGGYITRQYGKPASSQHSLQLEMPKVHYMNDDEKIYDSVRADRMRLVLKKTLSALNEKLMQLCHGRK